MRTEQEVLAKIAELKQDHIKNPDKMGYEENTREIDILVWVLEGPVDCIHTWSRRRKAYTRDTMETYCIHCGVLHI